MSTRNKETATSGPRDAAPRGNSQQHLPGNSELLMEKQLKPKGRQKMLLQGRHISLPELYKPKGWGELLTGSSGGIWQHPAPSGVPAWGQGQLQDPQHGRNRDCQGLMQCMNNHAAKSPSPAPSGPNPTWAGGQNSLKYSRKETQSTLQPESKQK